MAVCAIGAGGLVWFWLKPAAVERVEPVTVAVPVPTPASPQAEAPLVDVLPRPELRAQIRQPAALVGEPVIVSVRLRNPGALAAAHNSAAEAVVQPLSLNGNWRDFVELSVERLAADGQAEPAAVETALLKPGPVEPETEVGVRALVAAWVLSPESTAQMGPGDFRVSVKLKSAGLLAENYTDLAAQVDFSLAAPDGVADTTRLEQNVAFYYLNQNNCEATIEHALKTIELDPVGYPAYWYAAECYAAAGQTGDAVAMLEALLAVMPPALAGSDYHTAVELRLEQLQQARE